jgi:hypothetical protein
MSTQELPKHLGGLQHLAPDVMAVVGDVLVTDGHPDSLISALAGLTVGEIEADTDMRVYRRIPVAKQGDIDTSGWKKVKAGGYEGLHPEMPVAQCHAQPGDAYNPAHGYCAGGGLSPQGAKAALPSDAKARKGVPLYSGLLKYFPRALCAVAELSRIGNEQHNPGKPLHWDRSKSGDEGDALMRHLMEAGTVDSDGVRHSTKVCWRSLALLEKELEGLK